MSKKIAFRFGKNKIGIIPWFEIYNHFEKLHGDITGVMFTLVISKLLTPKTYNQLKYFHSDGFLLRLADAMSRAGTYGKAPEDERKRKAWAKRHIKRHPDVMMYTEEPNAYTGEMEKVLESFADASKEKMSRVIDWCIETGRDYLGVELETSDAYKKRMGFK